MKAIQAEGESTHSPKVSGQVVRSSAFTRSGGGMRPGRLKAELQTGVSGRPSPRSHRGLRDPRNGQNEIDPGTRRVQAQPQSERAGRSEFRVHAVGCQDAFGPPEGGTPNLRRARSD